MPRWLDFIEQTVARGNILSISTEPVVTTLPDRPILAPHTRTAVRAYFIYASCMIEIVGSHDNIFGYWRLLPPVPKQTLPLDERWCIELLLAPKMQQNADKLHGHHAALLRAWLRMHFFIMYGRAKWAAMASSAFIMNMRDDVSKWRAHDVKMIFGSCVPT